MSMLDTCRALLTHQFEAALAMLSACVDRCPEGAWNSPVGNLAFCQVAFHTLFFADLYLGPDEPSLREQQFHRENAGFFRDYEELQDRRQQLLYDRAAIKRYVDHCRRKARDVIAAETDESLTATCGFPHRTFTRAELHVYNIRHIQHHAAQLSLRLRIDFHAAIPWIGSGWPGQQ
jgi:hypothetical protein